MTSRSSVWLLSAALALGCSKKQDKPAPTEVPVAESGIAVVRDSTAAATIEGSAFDEGRPLSSVSELGPAGEWRLVTVRGEGGRELYVRDPAREYQGHTIKLYRDSRGRPSVGVFRDVIPKASDRMAGLGAAPVVFLTGVASIEVRTVKEELADVAPAVTVEVRVPGAGGPVTLDAKRLEKLPVIKPPDQREGSTGWLLRDVLGAAHPVDGAPAVQLVDAAGSVVDIPAGTLTDPSQVLFLKLNRRGQFRFKWWKLTGAAPDSGEPGKAPKHVTVLGELRGVQTISVR